jgi:hypothetical protein
MQLEENKKGSLKKKKKVCSLCMVFVVDCIKSSLKLVTGFFSVAPIATPWQELCSSYF